MSPVSRNRSLLAGILALAAAMGIGRFAYTPLLPAMQAAGGLDTAQAGFLASANYAGYMVGALLIAVAVPISAQTRVLRLAAIAVVLTTALMAGTSGLAVWSVVRFLSGLASAGVLVLASGLVLDDLRRQGRVSRSGWLYSGVGLGIATAGIVVGATGGRWGWRGDWLLLAVIAAAALVPCWHWLPRTRHIFGRTDETGPLPHGGVPAATALLYAAYFLEGLGYIVTGTFLVVIVDRMPGLTGLGAGVWIIVGLAVIPASALWAALASGVGYARALTAAYLLQAVGIVLPVIGGAGAGIASAVLFGGTFAGITALTLTLAGQLAPYRSAALIGMLTAVFGLGQIIGPVIAGSIASRTQSFAPALVAAAVCVAIGGGLMAALSCLDERHRNRASLLDGEGLG